MGGKRRGEQGDRGEEETNLGRGLAEMRVRGGIGADGGRNCAGGGGDGARAAATAQRRQQRRWTGNSGRSGSGAMRIIVVRARGGGGLGGERGRGTWSCGGGVHI